MKNNTGDLLAKAQQELMTPVQKYYDTVRQLDEKQTRAMTMSGDDKIKLLAEVQQAWSGLTSSVAEGETTIISQVQSVAMAMDKIRTLGSEMEAEKARQITSAETQLKTLDEALRLAQERVDSYSKTLVALGAKIDEINKDITFRVNDMATPVIRQIKAELESLRTGGVTITASMAASYGMPDASAYDSYAVGTPYVPRTGLALIHQGERIITAADNARGNYSSNAVTFSGNMSFTLPNVTNQSSARDLAKQVMPELEQLFLRKRAA
jgi:hypothetical protein